MTAPTAESQLSGTLIEMAACMSVRVSPEVPSLRTTGQMFLSGRTAQLETVRSPHELCPACANGLHEFQRACVRSSNELRRSAIVDVIGGCAREFLHNAVVEQLMP